LITCFDHMFNIWLLIKCLINNYHVWSLTHNVQSLIKVDQHVAWSLIEIAFVPNHFHPLRDLRIECKNEMTIWMENIRSKFTLWWRSCTMYTLQECKLPKGSKPSKSFMNMRVKMCKTPNEPILNDWPFWSHILWPKRSSLTWKSFQENPHIVSLQHGQVTP
jgi:hypothetical protein